MSFNTSTQIVHLGLQCHLIFFNYSSHNNILHIFLSSRSADVALKTGKIVNSGLWVFVKDYTSFYESAEGQAKSKREMWNSGFVI